MKDSGMEKAQRSYDNQTPDDSEGCCPECGSPEIRADRYGCECQECGYESNCFDKFDR